MSRKPTILTFLLLFISSFSLAQNQKEADILSLKKLVEDTFQDILTDFKSDKIGDYFTEDFILIENGEIWNNDSLRNYLEKGRLRTPKQIRENKFDFFNIEIKDDIAWVSYYNTATFTTENSPQRIITWIETLIAVRTEEGWRMKLLHNSLGKK
ncbi:MAG: nuclear transport factor 2 family protein [Algoriphagus sp.]|nr:nuclear transport factor 2 family protein [Algoriphagus sp.]